MQNRLQDYMKLYTLFGTYVLQHKATVTVLITLPHKIVFNVSFNSRNQD